jgi:hypothetical protein
MFNVGSHVEKSRIENNAQIIGCCRAVSLLPTSAHNQDTVVEQRIPGVTRLDVTSMDPYSSISKCDLQWAQV